MRRSFRCCIILSLASFNLFGQSSDTTRRVPTSAIPFLTMAPDARSAAMGEAGVALSADVNAAYWNASRLPYAERDFGATVSYTPWLRNLVDDMWLGYASAYKKLGKGQAVAVSVNYFKHMGIEGLYTQSSTTDIALNGTYARQLGKNFSMGITLKYISSGVGTGVLMNGQQVKPGRMLAGDISAYYRKQIKNENSPGDFTWSLGAVLSNFGNKINYGPAYGDRFIPTTLKIGGGLSYSSDGRNRFNFVMDAGKLMTPTPKDGINVNAKPVLKGMLGSFSDAPDGFGEEMKEIALSLGAEYWYKSVVALRAGYHNENKNKSARRYVTAGAGLRLLKNYGVDFARLFPVKRGDPLVNTFRLSLSAYFGKVGS